MVPASLASLPFEVLLRLHIFLGVQIAPIFAWTGRFATPHAVLTHARAQLELLTNFLATDIVVPDELGSILRDYCAVCGATAAAVTAPFYEIASQALFYPGFNEAARADFVTRTYRDASETPTVAAALLPPHPEPYDLSDYLSVYLSLSANPLEAWLALNRDDPYDSDLVEEAVNLLEAAEYSSYTFYPADFEHDRAAVVLLRFAFFGVAGTLAAQEPFVDAAGFYL